MGIDFSELFGEIDLSNERRVERLDEFELSVEDRLASGKARAIAQALLGLAAVLPARDQLDLTVTVDGESASGCEDGGESRARIDRLFDVDSTDEAEVGFRIIIRKSVSANTLSVYDLRAFGQYLEGEPLRNVLSAIASRFDGSLKLACSELRKPGGSASIRFVAEDLADSEIFPARPWERDRVITLFKETSFSASIPIPLIPSDFQLHVPLEVPAIDDFFVRASAVMSALYLCNNAELGVNNTVSYRLSGYKLVEEQAATVASLAEAGIVLGKIAGWAYDAGGSADKIGLARNVISLHVSSLGDLRDQPQVLNAILSNYQIYLKDNVSAYLEVRSRMAELLMESTAKTHALVESSLDSVRNGMLIVFTFVLTVVVVNGLKDTGPKTIFSGEYFWIVVAITGLCSVWIHHSCKDVVVRFDAAVAATKQLMRDSYRNVLIEEEVDQHTNTTFAANRDHLTLQVGTYRRIWYGVSLLLIFVFAVGYLAVYQLPSRVAPQSETTKSSGSSGASGVAPQSSSEAKAGAEDRMLPSRSAPDRAASAASSTASHVSASTDVAVSAPQTGRSPPPVEDKSAQRKPDPAQASK